MKGAVPIGIDDFEPAEKFGGATLRCCYRALNRIGIGCGKYFSIITQTPERIQKVDPLRGFL